MERLLSSAQMRLADEYTINQLGVPTEILVQRAGIAVGEEIVKKFKGGRVLVCVGKGNNGEDGKVVAQYLSKIHGFTVATLNVSNGIFKLLEKDFDIIVDCIFGTGLSREIEGKYKEAIEKINKSSAFVVSCDIPSGINADNGKVMGCAVRAKLTIAIQELKLGHFLNDAVDYCGEIIKKDIGISVWEEDCVKMISNEDASRYFQPRNRNVNKGTFGKACVFGGSSNYPGSAILAYNALASMKMGVGYTFLAVPKSLYEICLSICPECVLISISDDGKNFMFDKENVDKVLKCDSIAFGMGVGDSIENYKILEYLLKNYTGKLIIDADGINILSKYGREILREKKCQVVLTPHVGEFSRLIEKDKKEVVEDTISLAKTFAREYKVNLIVKSAVSVITNGEETYINTTGNSGLAKAGSGDVLSGLMAGILARDGEIIDGVVVSSYVFGKAGDVAWAEENEYTMTASSVIKALPRAIKELN